MATAKTDKKKLLDRVRRIRGQVEGLERALEEDRDRATLLNTIAACKGAMNGLMAQLMEEHIRSQLLDPRRKATEAQSAAAEELVDLVKAYLR